MANQKKADIKRSLAAEKQKFGGYDDSRGLRYLPTRYYIQLADYKGGLSYTRWFAKSFPDDIGFPDFLFKWALLLFQAGKFAQAKAKVWQTFCANIYVLDKFLGHPLQPLPKDEWSNLARAGFMAYFTYSHQQADLLDFAQWLEAFMGNEFFAIRKARFLSLYQRLLMEGSRNQELFTAGSSSARAGNRVLKRGCLTGVRQPFSLSYKLYYFTLRVLYSTGRAYY